MTGTEHLNWCKERALEYVKKGDLNGAYASFTSDMRKHPETENHAALGLGAMLLMSGHLGIADEMEKFITGFN